MQYLNYILLGVILGWSIIEILKSLDRNDYSIEQQLQKRKDELLKIEHQKIKDFHNNLGTHADHTKQMAFKEIHDFCTSKLEFKLDEIHEVIRSIQKLYRSSYETDNEFKANFPEKSDLQFSPVETHHILTILNEGLHNATIYAQAKYITTIVAIENKQLQLVTHDTGIGYDKSTVQHGEGLERLKEMVALRKGSVTITSTQNGTIVNATVPV